MIKFDNLSKYYPTKQGRRYVLKNVNLAIPTDVNIAVLGPNGVGKSTLIRMLGGADYPSQGAILSDKKISWPLGLQGGLQGSMTGRENARFVARIHGIKDTKEIEEKVAEFAEIGAYFDEPVKTYSSGMKSRVTFGLTMGFDFDFDVLLIDELGAVGDANFRKKSQAVLKEKFESTKLIMVSHSMGELRKHCQSGILIKDQTLVFFSDLEEAIHSYEETYVRAS
ncbi:ABC transporter ATP-binding protein [Bermanella marisrubri]|uniref:Capsular polysaccharide ABC transporter, ATP-binding protein n=1 Tax=Bermanella marisrubri TaxID=207949 RepID=Q1N090_9GAMM|nr:ABC transporter ATP-binding protein [Bermanella marisrubri]EAT11627.1 capsular polysaccharide ABC transporter, ATP-binding protein [Oceanobacter sp. RED65] [Bermanella marisrubri]QIZ83330.1 ABC transporter ATP-binding protein [Bermanella marisrubri]